MNRPLVLTHCSASDREKARRILDALRDAASWTCDGRSQIPCLRFVGSDGERRIVLMDGAVIDPDDDRSRKDGHQRIADALRDAAIACLRRALLPVDPEEVDEAVARRDAYSVVVSSQVDCGPASADFVLSASSPWRPAHYRTYEAPFGLPTPGPSRDAPNEGMSPVMFAVSEGDSGHMRNLSIGLYSSTVDVAGGATPMDALRAGSSLLRPWRSA